MTHSIGQAAAAIGLHPQTLREYERHGLLMPARTAGGTRRYGIHELQQLVRIQRLTREGMSLGAVRYVLELEDRVALLEQLLAETARRQSISMELVHLPRPARSTRWRNTDSR